MIDHIFDKTDKGREEIVTRMYHLPSRLRSLLVLIDGKQPASDLLGKVAGLGLNEQSLHELFQNGFIQDISEMVSHVSSTMEFEESVQEKQVETTISYNQTSEIVEALHDGENQYQALYRFYTETIKSIIGLRGYALQLKVERASTVNDLRALRTAYLEAVRKAKGTEMARSLSTRLDQLLYLDQSPPQRENVGSVIL